MSTKIYNEPASCIIRSSDKPLSPEASASWDNIFGKRCDACLGKGRLWKDGDVVPCEKCNATGKEIRNA